MTDETIGELHDRLPDDEWVNLPQFGVRVKKFSDPTDLARPDPGASTSAQLRQARDELATAQREIRRLTAELDSALTALNKQRADAETMRIQLAGVVQFASAFQPGAIVVARQDVGPCVLCGRPIVRSQGVQAAPGSTTQPTWAHAVCPDPEEKQ